MSTDDPQFSYPKEKQEPPPPDTRIVCVKCRARNGEKAKRCLACGLKFPEPAQ